VSLHHHFLAVDDYDAAIAVVYTLSAEVVAWSVIVPVVVDVHIVDACSRLLHHWSYHGRHIAFTITDFEIARRPCACQAFGCLNARVAADVCKVNSLYNNMENFNEKNESTNVNGNCWRVVERKLTRKSRKWLAPGGGKLTHIARFLGAQTSPSALSSYFYFYITADGDVYASRSYAV